LKFDKKKSYPAYLQFANHKTSLKGIKEVINLLKIVFFFKFYEKRNRKKCLDTLFGFKNILYKLGKLYRNIEIRHSKRFTFSTQHQHSSSLY